ncbi:pleckstrin homology domain-containing family G member 4B isoform X2 [Notolabrus celidotus]|nr:pleckstrin homology domain-containing family G member 4B isoform X2 [Notolabrus celidotus]XP_034535750.1 pleckstrin homology domain-containing family G member 4B isoform X2 [Notolabrus celidotus]XP_034535751.1 pleckstrin homology domain-containing family G member 4B isoform X2 [Notolabrus celidotus]XP_034535752.1 pleckstrin homology domain-containing family G member 4B isoform X2 [Notolabrus celidotus]
MAWLDSVNREREQRGASRLERCLLSANGDVFRVPWEDLVYPQFISQPRTSLKEDKESSIKEGDLLINTNQCRDANTSKQDVKLLPSSPQTDQSQASSEDSDSEGEYVELSELPLPLFSPQKGSLTQSISLQHRARTSTHTTAHTPLNTTTTTNTHTPLQTSDTHSSTSTQPQNTHKSINAHSTVSTHTLTAAMTHTTHSSGACEEVSSHTGQRSRITEESQDQDSSGSIILTPISSSSSTALPDVVETSSCQSQEQTQGTDSGRGLMPNTEPANCTEQKEREEVGEEKQEKEGETEIEEGELTERQKETNERVVSDDEGEEKEGEQQEDTESKRDEDYESETEDDGEEESDDELEEVEVEEEVQFIIVQHSQDRREDEEQQVTREEERGGEEKHIEQEVETQAEGSEHTHSEGSEHTPFEGSEHTHSEKSCSENNANHTHSEGTDCENKTHLEESSTPHTHSEGSDGVKHTPHTHSEGSDGVKHTPHTHSEGSDHVKHTLHTHSLDSFSEENTIHTNYEDSRSENNKHTHPEDTYCENNTHMEKSNTPQTHPEDRYYETNIQSEDSNPEEDSFKTLAEESKTPEMNSDSHRTQESEKAQEKLEEEEKKEEKKEEVGGGRTAELQTEGLCSETPPAQTHVSLPDNPRPAEPKPARAARVAPAVPVRFSQTSQSSQLSQSSQYHFYSVLKNSAALCLPGTRDRGGRALLTICTNNTVWSNPDCDSAELLRLLLYYTSTLRKEVMALGLTALVDARRALPLPVMFSALRSLQENIPGSIHSVLLLVNKDSSLRLEKPPAIQVEVLNSLKSVQKHVELRQLPAEFGGSFSFSQSSWLCFRSRVEQLTSQCEDVINLLQKNINNLQSTPLPAAAQDAELLLSRYKAVMGNILADSRLVQLQQEGGALLSRLRREESSLSETEDYRAALETVSTLYNEVDELLHRLVTLSNSRTEELTFILEFSRLEQGFNEVKSWLDEVGEVRLTSLDEPDDSLELLNKKQQDFKDFHTTAYENCRRGEELLSHLERWGDVSSADLRVYEVKVHSFWARLQDFSQRVKITGTNIERAVCLYRFLDQAYGWALEGMRHLAGVSMEECTLPDKCQSVIGCLEDYQRQHPPIPDGRFQEMKALAEELRGERGLRQWSFAWSKCQETKKMFDRKMEAALRTRDSAHRQRSDSIISRNSISSRRSLSGLLGVFERSSSCSSSSCVLEEDTPSPSRSTSFSQSPLASSTLTPQHTPLLQRLLRSPTSEESSDKVEICSSSPCLPRFGSCHSFTPSLASSPSTSSFGSCRRQQLRKTQSFDCPPTPESTRYGPNPRALSEPVRRGNTGVFIRGLEVSSSEAADNTLCPRTPAHGWAGPGLCSPRTPSTPRTNGSPATDSRPRGSKLRHVVEEMVTTEREYVRSLSYVIRHYFPMMDRADLPQDLRGKRSVVFGNLEKLLDFHSQFFLKELEACWKHPLRVPHCFLRHQEQFSLYALYSKNKPKSDALLALHGHSFFRRKQVELGDKMDLSSYLLKPVQRMSKYALLLTDLMKEVGGAQEAEHVALQDATSMVKFQLRHGNDLLAMDAIRDCDVNLKEQGQLIRQDEFTVWTGRRKCQRHIFLFEELVLFSKPKKMEGGLDVFIYKHSFKTADVGLTESAGDDGLRFEIWFRRRTSKNQTFILQAPNAEVKHAWTSGIARILWTQASKNKEMRLKEMVSMGVGNKPFLDIQPSDAAISDRAVHYIMKSRGARTRASIAVSVFDHSNPFKRGVATSDPGACGPSSSGLLGPLNLHMYSQTLSSSPAAESSFITSCIEEDEQEHETSSQPSMTTESSGSSSRCLSGSTGSDSGCVSSHLQEALPEEPSPTSQPSSSSSSSSCYSSNKQHHLNNQYISPKTAPVISPATIV